MYSIHLFKNFNNYYNRQLIKYDTLGEYLQNDKLIQTFENRNFDIQDGLATKHIINYASADLPVPDYCVVENEDNHEFSRWFVIECRQTRGCQYEISLKRDIIAEHYEVLKASPCLIKKGYVGNDNVLVFNKEQQEYNKIKSKELLIKDSTGIGYVVGFIGKDTAGSDNSKVYSSYNTGMQVDFDYDSLTSQMKNYFAIGSATPTSTIEDRTMSNIEVNSIGAAFEYYVSNGGYYYGKNEGLIPIYRSLHSNDYNVSINSQSTLTSHLGYKGTKTANLNTIYTFNDYPSTADVTDIIIKPFYEAVRTTMTSKLNNQNVNYDIVLDVDRSFINTLQSYNNKICCINNVYYKCTFMKVANGTGTKTNDNYSFTYNIRQSLPTSSELTSIGSNNHYKNISVIQDNFTSSDININYGKYKCYIKLTQQNINIYTYITPKANRNHLIDAPYDMFVFPYSDDYTYTVNATSYTANRNMALNLAQSICEASGSDTYDIQIVPYCPFDVQHSEWGLFNYQAIYNNSNNIIGYYFWADRASRDITISENRSELTLSNNPSYKEITQLNKYILCSPDKNSQWEFNPAMNHGITNWVISYEYRPFSSYIKIEPEFDWLYGGTYYNGLSDTRGLLINSAYSLTQLNDAWANYLNNNKNYQQIFDTQINTEINKFNKSQKAQWDTVGYRNYSINPLSFLKVIGESKQMDFDREIFNMDISAQREIFNYQLDNIQNQPDTIRKLTSINIDFRIFPFVEIYEPTDQERNIFGDSIRYNGMTIMVTGYIENYLKPNDETFIQATVIRYNEDIQKENDYTLVSELNKELNTGVYITQ